MFENRIKELRKQAGLTQEKFAKEIGVSLATVAMWETGKRKPSYKKMHMLAEYFCVNLAELEESPENLDHDIIEAAPFLDSIFQVYDYEKLLMTIISLDDESREKICSQVYALEKKCRKNRTLKDVRNYFVDVRFSPEPDKDQLEYRTAEEDFEK